MHPRTRHVLDGTASRRRRRCVRSSRSATSRCSRSRRRRRACRDGLRRPAEGGVLVRRSVRHAPSVDGVDGHRRRRREHARRPTTSTRSRAVARACVVSRRRAPALRRRARRETHRGRSVPFRARMGGTSPSSARATSALPLAQTFARSGPEGRARRRRRVGRRRDQPRREPHQRRPVRRRCEPLVESGAISATTDYAAVARRRRDPDRRPDAALAASASRTSRTSRAPRRASRRTCARGTRRARVDDLPGHDARDPAAAARGGQRPEGGRRLPPRVLAGAGRPGQREVHDEDDAEGRRRRRRRVDRGGGRAVPRRRSTTCTSSRRPRRRS